MSLNPEESSSDFEKIVAALNREQVEFLIIGAFAVAHYGHVRNTQDLDIYIRPTPVNAGKTVRALKAAGFSGEDVKAEFFTIDNGVRLGELPEQVDLISYLPGVDPDELWRRRESGHFGGESVFFISREDLIANKRVVGRVQDVADVEMLKKNDGTPDGPNQKNF